MAKPPENKSEQLKARIDAIARAMLSGKQRAEILRIFAKKWHIAPRSIDRYIEFAKIEAERMQNLAKSAEDKVIVAEATEAIKNGIKTKNERVLALQKLWDECEADMVKMKDPEKKIYARKVMKDIQAEISKIQGDYAPEKKELVGKFSVEKAETVFE